MRLRLVTGLGSALLPLLVPSGAAAADVACAPGPQPACAHAASEPAVVRVAWSHGQWRGEARRTLRTELGSLGVSCRPGSDGRAIVFAPRPAAPAHELQMLNWITWTGDGEHARPRRDLRTQTNALPLSESLDRTESREPVSAGSVTGLLYDRGPYGSTAAPVAGPVAYRIAWNWDLRSARHGRCRIVLTRSAPGPSPLQLSWRGETPPPSATVAEQAFSGIGTVRVRCERGQPGDARDGDPHDVTGGSRDVTIDSDVPVTIRRLRPRWGTNPAQDVVRLAAGTNVVPLEPFPLWEIRTARAAMLLASDVSVSNFDAYRFCFAAATTL